MGNNRELFVQDRFSRDCSMRERTTWKIDGAGRSRNADYRKATQKRADIYTMNQQHPQPSADDYVIGGPSEFAEDVHLPNRWVDEYAGDTTSRNEIGAPEFRADTFNHPEKTAAMDEHRMLKKADLCVKIAKLMLRGGKVAGRSGIEDQSTALMHMPYKSLIATYIRLAEQEAEQEAEEVEKQAQQQDQDDDDVEEVKQARLRLAQRIERRRALKAQQEESEKEPEQAKQAQQETEKEPESQDKQAEQDQAEESKQAGKKAQQEESEKEPESQDKQAKKEPVKKAQQESESQSEPTEQQSKQAKSKVAQEDLEACSDMLASEEDLQVDQDLDALLADDGDDFGDTELGLQLDADPLDLSEDEDPILRDLFAQQDEPEVQESKQAKVRNASTKTVGTKPKSGVSRLGGLSKTAGSDSSIDKLSALWQSAPDVRDVFGLK